MIQEMARDFAEKEIKPKAPELDKTERHPAEIIQKMAELNLMGIAIPEVYGGGGADIVSYVVALEEISRESRPCASASCGGAAGRDERKEEAADQNRREREEEDRPNAGHGRNWAAWSRRLRRKWRGRIVVS